MRNGFTPEIDASEITESELDNISGGLASFGGEIAGHGGTVTIGDAAGTAQSLAPATPAMPASPIDGLVTVETTGF
ncbi:hypothetical protein FCH28_33865 [Streptomyces piniterrae]|uniref:Type A2 lantipeptide n=1 Tax=Streptomyces piniterrae TaxID=2571125 RepID=A0A4U0N009_9ACTN|nr:hypothetical protein [Streptomyces piniterrae]TJZ42874.1 hypothetical protein FCH28_33865 [Streptomyces piniterrae]